MDRFFVFLDIDGVLNKESMWNKPFSLSDNCIDNFGKKYHNSRVILISSWKAGFICSHDKNNTPQIKELEQKLDKYNIRIIGKVNDEKYRDLSINKFVQEHGIINYIIIDDDISEYSSNNIDNLLLVDAKKGFE